MEASVKIRRPPGTTLNETSGHVSVDPDGPTSVVYTGIARIWTVDNGPAIFLGDAEPVETRVVRVSLPVDAPLPRIDDTCEILSCPYDLDMDGRYGVITGVDGGGQLRSSRVITVKGMFESKSWQP
jgi:hypothetical protein